MTDKIKLIFVLLSISYLMAKCSPITGSDSMQSAWDSYKYENGLKLKSNEEKTHYQAFSDNYLKVINHNKQFELNNETYKVKLSEFSHISDTNELTSNFGLKSFIRPNDTDTEEYNFDQIARVIIPESVDWRPYSTSVKDQRKCGSCWAFASVGVVEFLHAIKYKSYKTFSEQQLIDCTVNNPSYLSYGCRGGWPDRGFEYIKRNGVIEEYNYPYIQRVGVCNPRYDLQKVRLSQHYSIPYGDENALKKAVALYGPVAVGIDASKWGFLHYSSGIYTDYGCSSRNVNHAVIVVGYGTEYGRDYWIIKNSWGTKWGMGGYAKMARNNNNMCGITSLASFAIL